MSEKQTNEKIRIFRISEIRGRGNEHGGKDHQDSLQPFRVQEPVRKNTNEEWRYDGRNGSAGIGVANCLSTEPSFKHKSTEACEPRSPGEEQNEHHHAERGEKRKRSTSRSG